MKQLYLLFTGPEVYAERSNRTAKFVDYKANALEELGNSGLQWWHWSLSVAKIFSPVVLTHALTNGVFAPYLTSARFYACIAVAVLSLYLVRCLGRMNSDRYLNFLKHYSNALDSGLPGDRLQLQLYDYDFAYQPVDYVWKESESRRVAQINSSVPVPQPSPVADLFSWLLAKCFGIYILYPGTMPGMYSMVKQSLKEGRRQLIEVYYGHRYRLQTKCGILLDCLLMDRRNMPDAPNANTLVIACEGNAGFYEIGVSLSPLEAGYSVLGWNHPGFGHSTGMPWPQSECNAIEVVVQFALSKGFKEEDIVILAWSIGAYAGTWAAVQYPKIQGLFLDATFDDLLPLALPLFPNSLESLVERTIRKHFNLHIADQLKAYAGPVTIVRRNQDEILCTKKGDISSIRTNDLIISFLSYRYPLVFDQPMLEAVREWLTFTPMDRAVSFSHLSNGSSDRLMSTYLANEAEISSMSDEERTCVAYALFQHHVIDIDLSHCIILPSQSFSPPVFP